MPIASPRCCINQRFTTAAPNVVDVAPVAPPTSTPQINTICQGAFILLDSATAPANTASAVITVRRIPKRCIAAAANGPIKPNNARLIANAIDMVVRVQPKPRSSGTIITLGVARIPAVTNMIRNVTAITTHA